MRKVAAHARGGGLSAQCASCATSDSRPLPLMRCAFRSIAELSDLPDRLACQGAPAITPMPVGIASKLAVTSRLYPDWPPSPPVGRCFPNPKCARGRRTGARAIAAPTGERRAPRRRPRLRVGPVARRTPARPVRCSSRRFLLRSCRAPRRRPRLLTPPPWPALRPRRARSPRHGRRRGCRPPSCS
jgi:hypothetical protein